MYQKGDKANLVSVQSMKGYILTHRTLKECLRITQGKLFNKRHSSVANYQLEIVEIINYNNGKKGYIGYCPLNTHGTQAIVGHCNYPSYSDENESEYRWTIYHIGRPDSKVTMPFRTHFEDVKLVDKWINEGIHVNKFIKNLKYIFD